MTLLEAPGSEPTKLLGLRRGGRGHCASQRVCKESCRFFATTVNPVTLLGTPGTHPGDSVLKILLQLQRRPPFFSLPASPGTSCSAHWTAICFLLPSAPTMLCLLCRPSCRPRSLPLTCCPPHAAVIVTVWLTGSPAHAHSLAFFPAVR